MTGSSRLTTTAPSLGEVLAIDVSSRILPSLAQEPRVRPNPFDRFGILHGSPRQQQQAICSTCRGLHLGSSRWVAKGLHGDPIALLTPHGSLAGAPFPLLSLPSALLGSILSLLEDDDDGQQTGPKARAAVRLSSKSLRDAYDACNTKIKLGCTDGTPPLVFRTTRSKGRASAHASYLDMALFLIARTPCLDDFTIQYSFSYRESNAKQLLSRLTISCLSRLKRLEIQQPFDGMMLAPLKLCSSLQELKLKQEGPAALTTLSDMLSDFKGLRRLELLSDNSVDIDKLAKCAGLESLTLQLCSDLRALSSLAALKRLSMNVSERAKDVFLI